MAIDFFEHQEVARKKTGLLVFLFVLAVVSIMALVYVVVAWAVIYSQGEDVWTATGEQRIGWASLLDLKLLGLVGAGTILVVGGGSLYKISELAGGGRVIAEQLGGRRLDHATSDPVERKLLNVVDEMAIASGTPVPPVYLMDGESGINAFAAGHTVGNAVIGVTRGSAERLSRDELQGVIAHEFSHILNGDMRLNIRLIGFIHGILIVGLIGYFVFRSALYSGAARRRSSKDNPMPLLALGGALMVIGFLGTLFGNLIKASVSRQREFLADAAAVQFTRQPDGIGGALKKIGGFTKGSTIASPNAPQASHMFFGQALTASFSSMFATHPPLRQRISRIDPSWDGAFEAGEAVAAAPRTAGVTAGFAAGAAPGQAVERIGQPGADHLRYAADLVHDLPQQVIAAVHEPYGARAVIYAMLIDPDATTRGHQLEQLRQHADEGVYDETLKLLKTGPPLSDRARLPVVDLAIPALRALSPAQYGAFRQNVEVLVRADRKIDLFEWTLQRVLLHHLESHFTKAPPPRVMYYALNRLANECELLLSTLAYVGHETKEEARHALEVAAAHLKLPQTTLLPSERCGLEALDGALEKLNRVAPRLKRQVLSSCVACISADHEVTDREAELLRAVSDSLGCPMPPILGSADLAT